MLIHFKDISGNNCGTFELPVNLILNKLIEADPKSAKLVFGLKPDKDWKVSRVMLVSAIRNLLNVRLGKEFYKSVPKSVGQVRNNGFVTGGGSATTGFTINGVIHGAYIDQERCWLKKAENGSVKIVADITDMESFPFDGGHLEIKYIRQAPNIKKSLEDLVIGIEASGCDELVGSLEG